jgi:hypothetical protein
MTFSKHGLSERQFFSKHGLSERKFCCNIPQLWQPAIAKWFALERPFFGEP